ncbi:hypothetical protein AAG906_013151 [Vitis piasezkii]
MAIPSSSSHTEIFSKHRAPFFTGTDYPYWKTKMTWFLQSTDLDVWDVIEDGPTFPTKLVDGVLVPKPKQEWNELDRRNFQLNAKAVFTLQCAMDRNEYNRILKESKINLLVHNYELFSMKENETIVEMITRFTDIVNGLEALGKTYKESEKVMKILRSLPSKWHTKVTAIQEAKDLTKLPMEELIGSLMTYEINLAKKLQEGEDKKKKSIALKATTKEEEDVEEEKPSEEDDYLALITRKLNKYMRNERFRGRKFTSRRDPSKKESSSHGDKEKWEEKRDLVMMATWSDSEESSKEKKEKEVANMCFMAIDDLDEFAFLTKRKGGYVTFGDNAKGRIIGQGNIDRRQQEEVGEDPKKEESPLALHPPHQVQGESSQDLPKDWKFVINHPQDQIIEFSKCMHSEFEMSMMGELNFFLGLQIKQLKEITFINQAKYIRDLLKRFNMEEAKTMKTPMSSSIKIDKDEKGKSIDSTMYRGMIESHLSVVKRILRYLKGTMDIGLWYPKGDNFELIGYSDADFAGCKVERKSTSGTCHFLGHSLVSWHTKKQNSVALSTAEAEYIAVVGLKEFLTPSQLSERESAASRAQGKRPAELSQPDQSEARRKARYDTVLFMVTISEPIFSTLIRAFYSRVTYGLGGPITSTVRGVEITLSPESICQILDIPSVGLRVYESKVWPTVSGFEPREAIQRMCGLVDAQGMGKPSTHSLIVISRVLHHMVCSILLPRGGHRDEVSYLEAFIVDSILTGRRIHVGYLMMMHMISCCESKTRVFPCGRFLTRVFKDVGVDLSRETNFEAPTTYDTYDEQSLGQMKFEKTPNGSWIKRAERPPAQDQGQGQMHPGDEEEAEIREIEGSEFDIPPLQTEGAQFEASFPEPMISESAYTPSHAEISSQAPHAPDHAPWMDLSADRSLGTRMEELAVVSDTRFYSMEDRIDQYLGVLRSVWINKHEEMMAYLRSMFPPPLP